MVWGSIHMSAVTVDDLGLFKLILAAGMAFRECSWLRYLHRIYAYFRFSKLSVHSNRSVKVLMIILGDMV
jgi:hypothetical protein